MPKAVRAGDLRHLAPFASSLPRSSSCFSCGSTPDLRFGRSFGRRSRHAMPRLMSAMATPMGHPPAFLSTTYNTSECASSESRE
eukprot:3386427-Pyramimonas_sp.AAC.2